MTFLELKTYLINSARIYEICKVMKDIEVATTYPQLIRAGLPIFDYAWRLGFITDAIFLEFPDQDLMNQGIYYNKTGNITPAPTIPYSFLEGFEIWLINGTPNVTSSSDIKINVWNANSSITASAAYMELDFYNSEGSINSVSDAIIHSSVRNPIPKVVTVNMDDTSQQYIDAELYAVLNLNRSGNAFATVNTYGKTTTNIFFPYDQNVLILNAYHEAQINYSEELPP